MRRNELSKPMLKMRKAHRLTKGREFCWYIEPHGIHIYAQPHHGDSVAAKLSATQLRNALAVIDEFNRGAA